MEHEPLLLPQSKTKLLWCWMAFQYLLLPQLVFVTLGVICSDALVNFVYHLLSFLGVFLILGESLLNAFRRAAAHPKRCVLVCVLSLMVYYAAAWAVTAAIRQLESAFSNRNDAAVLLLRRDGLVLTAITTIFLAPLSEECLFRGLMFGQTLKKSRLGAYALSAICFALIHVMGYLGTYTPLQLVLSLVQYLPAGLILAWSYEKAGTIAVPILIHMIINAISMVQII